ncbi:hypothetical protein IYR97_25550 (plasmid) [Pseudomonas fulva]|jgi:hypothetical protein|uniref:Uncharacterized protein n=2 Tax=Pseudomonas putida group TaxID=136845 RepID=A0ABD7BNX8_PSEPU|nr:MULTISPECIES: hypothetical protein [Pseudomonas]MCT8162747.1 hypothetical protein [Pseudomonas sp. HD6422]MCT8181484.1 hypothetical protein [Pseudomonas sp. HD6421]MDH1928924.1 hypothetical protein [Pseudomonas sp. GD03696]ORL52071.1 hypothetical protein B7H18_08550 [Pseudomonas putida]ORL65445.1 hypothetical protein B7H19_22020 [Pseudomonas putida]
MKSEFSPLRVLKRLFGIEPSQAAVSDSSAENAPGPVTAQPDAPASTPLFSAPANHDDESIPPEHRYTYVFNKRVSELRVEFTEQHRLITEEGAKKPLRNVAYQAVVCDEQFNQVPLDARSIGLLLQASDNDPAMPSECFEFSLILATGTVGIGSIDVPYDTTVEAQEVIFLAESSGLSINLLPPPNATVVDERVEAYCDLIAEYARLSLGSANSNVRVSPIDGYMEYLLYVEMGYKPAVISTDDLMNLLYTDAMSEPVMDHVKARIEAVVYEVNGPDFTKGLVEQTIKALHLKNLQFMEARASILEAELDTRTPFPNMIRILAQVTGLRPADAAGMLFELKNSIHTVLDKYLPPDPLPEPAAPADESDNGKAAAVQEVDPATSEESGASGKRVRTPNSQQASLAKALCLMASSVAGGPEALKSLWASIEDATQLNERINLDRETTQPSAAATRLAEAVGVAPKVAALAAGEMATIAEVILVAGEAIAPPPPPTPPKPTPPSGLIAVG